MFRRQICSSLRGQVLQMDQAISKSLLISISAAYIQLFRCYTIIHANDDLLGNAIDLVNIRWAGSRR